MKHLLLALLLVSFSTALADTPAKIAEDYRKAATAALAKVNETLEKATVPLIATLVKAGDTTGAAELQQQLKTKLAGEPVLNPQVSAANIFKLYDAARVKALVPAQTAAVGRIEAMLNGKEGGNLEVVAELGKVRAEIEAGKAAVATVTTPALPTMPLVWDYFTGSDRRKKQAEMIFKPNGTVSILSTDKARNDLGKWSPTADPNVLNVTLDTSSDGEKCLFKILGNDAELVRPIGTRYLRVKP